MTYHDKIFIVGGCLLFMILQAGYQDQRFRAGHTISHNNHGILYALIAALFCTPYLLHFGWWVAVKMGGIAALQRLALYDFILNLMRGKRPLLSYNGKGTTGSWVDKLENLLPEKFILPLKIGYIVVFIVAVIFIK
jgi:hypothetical protein